ncbi:tetratricopeptide repeat protein [Halorientalis pallida]|uniref:tetratricopeptide repeat protein n=1 Tax=Halorientalis pallida TaxID=2479928 RepID=UPI003C6F8C14
MDSGDIEEGPSEIVEYMSLVGQRAEFLEYLCENTAQKRDLIDDLDVSRSTVDRALADLQDVGLVCYEDGTYETTATGVLAVKQYRAHIDKSADIRAAHEALRPLPPDTRLDPAMVVGASVSITEEPRPYAALQPVESAISDATEIRALLPNIADSRFVELYRNRIREGVDVEMVVSPELADRLREQFPTICQQMSTQDSFAAHEAEVPPFGLLLADNEGVTTVSVVVYTETGSVHAVVHTGTLDAVRWAEGLYEDVLTDATEVTSSFHQVEPASEAPESPIADGNTIIKATSDGSLPPASSALPVELEAEGFVDLCQDYFEQREANDPATCWRTGLRLVDVNAGYAVDRTREQDGERVNVTDSLFEDLQDGTDHIVLGPLGAGKSTVCKSIGCRWYEQGLGRVFYRESGETDPFESVAQLKATIEEQAGHTLVVVEDAVRTDANAIFTLARQFDGSDSVTFLLDARESEWQNPDALPVDARLDSYRASALQTVRLPELDQIECARFLNHFEETIATTVPTDAEKLLDEIRRETNDGETRRGEVLLLFHRLARYAQPSADVDEHTSTALLEDVQRTYQRLENNDTPYALTIGVLTNLLNAAQIGVYPEYIHAVADADDHETVERQLEAIEGSVFFSGEGSDSCIAPREAVHESWSAEFLIELLDSQSSRRAHRLVADCMSAVLSLADEPERRADVEWFFEGRRDRLDAIADNPTEWCDTIVEQLFSLGLKRPALAPLFGKSDYSRLSLPDACSEETRLRCSLWRGKMNQEAGNFDRAQHEYEYLIEKVETASIDEEQRSRIQADAHNRLGRTLSEQGKLSAAMNALAEAEELYRELEDSRGVADTLVERGYIPKTKGELDVAQKRLEEALEIYRELGNESGEAECLLELGILRHRQGNPEQGREQVETALELFQRLNSRNDEARCRNALGTIAAQQGQLDAAITQFQQSVELARSVGDTHREANSLNNLARAYAMAGEHDEAISYQQSAANIYEEIGDTNGQAASYHNLGESAREQGDLDTAEEYFEKARTLRKESDHTRRMYRDIHSLGIVHLERDDYDTARNLLSEALEKFREYEEPRREAAALRRLGEVAMETDELEEAKRHTEAAVEQAREANAQDFVLDGLEQLATIYERLGHVEQAIKCCKEAVSLTEQMGLDERRETLVEKCNRFESAVAAG